MRFVRPKDMPLPSDGERHVFGGNNYGRPQWLTDWLANQGRYVELSCGHYEDLNDTALLIIGTFKKCDVMCERCNAWATLKKSIRFNQYAGLPPIEKPTNDPLF